MSASWSCSTKLAAIALVAAAGQTVAQQSQPQMQMLDPESAPTVRQPYNIENFGEFRKLIQRGDFGAKVLLDAVMAKHPTTGVGAVADARGEITIYDGKLIVSYGKDRARPHINSEAAALLTISSVGEWQSVRVDKDTAPEEIESYIAAAAKAHGIDPERSFPFELRGTVTSYLMHVNAAPTAGPHGMGLPIAITLVTRGDEIEGRVAGLYVSPDLVGIATHGGERTHAHWVSPDGAATAHLDRWGLKTGAVLLLPEP